MSKMRILRRLLVVPLIAFLIAALSFIIFPPQTVKAVPAGFVYRCGIHFCLDGHLYYFAGTNTYDLFTYGGSYGDIETQYMDKTKIDAQFAQLAADGVKVLRTWMFNHQAWHGFEASKGVYSNEEFSEFDYIIQSAKAHNIKLIPTLENYWEAYGGIDQRLSWEGISGGESNRWKFFRKDICPGCFTQYKNYANYALNRINHYSGIAYKDDPTIFAWELMNEPRYQNATPNENSTGTTLRAWVDEMGAYVKSIDPKHMLDTGQEGHQLSYNFGGDEGNPFIYIQQSPYIDFTSAHPYPTESWANLSIAQAQTLIQTWINDSHNVVGKPFFMGEFNVSPTNRSAWWTAIFSTIENNNGDGDAFWWYQYTNVDSTYGEIAGAPELAVFRQHAANMAAKNGPIPPTATPAPTSTTCAACPTFTKTPLPTATSTITSTPTNTLPPSVTPTPVASGTFYRGINLNGGTVTINGNAWLSDSAARTQGFAVGASGYTDTKFITPTPAADANTSAMLNSLYYATSNLSFTQTVTSGNYQIYLWEMENYSSNSRSFNLKLEGQTAATGLGSLPINTWARFGPYNVTVSDGVLNIDLIMVLNNPMMSGIEIYRLGGVSVTNTPIPTFNAPTNTSVPATATKTNTPPPTFNAPTNTPIPATSTKTNTPAATSTGSAMHVEALLAVNSNQETQYHVQLHNDSAQSQTNLKVRMYLNMVDEYANGFTAADVVTESFWSLCRTVTFGPITAYDVNRKIYYMDVNWGSYAIPAGATCEDQFRFRLSGWQNLWGGSDDYSTQGLNASTMVRTQNMSILQNNTLIYGILP